MLNARRLLRLQELIREAEKLARDETHLELNDPRMTRLTMVLWVCRDVVDEVVEQMVHKPEPPEGRAEREHL